MANLLTVLRIILAIIAAEYILSGKPEYYISAFILTLFVIMLDGLDGVVARAMNESSKFGSVFDIIGDRIVENIYWIVFAITGFVSPAVPIIVMSRGIITDGLRGIALASGYTAFGSSTMMSNPVFKFLTASRCSRAVYGIAKAAAFFTVIIAYIPNLEEYTGISISTYVLYLNINPVLVKIANVLVFITVAMCIIRGLPVIIESKKYIEKLNEQEKTDKTDSV